MLLCKDCKYFIQKHPTIPNGPCCTHAESLKYDDPIFGNHTVRTCYDMRKEKDGKCGMTGKLWIPAAEFVKV
jgi:hypothetical protein